ncbi:MAG: hypothetical protein ACM3YN_11935 [Parcubacteria group bacterium]
MDQAYIIQFAVSAVAIVVLALVAAWARIPREVAPLDESSARAVIADELPGTPVERVWVDAAGQAAVAKAGSEAIVLFRVGDGFAVRQAPWSKLANADTRNGRVVIRFGDPAAPAAQFQLAPGATHAPFSEIAA